MCGIIGINKNDRNLLERSAQGFKYRGPDATAFFSDDEVTLGHHRLSIIDVDHRSDQPMFDDEGGVGVVFNGEIYNFRELRESLSDKYKFKTDSDTEVLLYAYKEWGSLMTERIQGMFAFAIYDRDKKKVFLARDHRGIKPLYYFAEKELFVFASEIKGVLAVLKGKGIDTPLNRDAIDLALAFGYVPSPHTLYVGISKLPRKSFMEYDLVQKKITIISQYSTPCRKTADEKGYAELIEQKILGHLVADVPVGIFFSGGTDSSLIAAVLHKHKINLETFSIKIDYKSSDAYYFGKISKHLGIRSHEYPFDVTEFDAVYSEVMEKVDEPNYDNSIFPTYFVSKKAAEKVKVVLSGEGGDEFFYGYPRSKVLKELNNFSDHCISFLDYLFLLSPSFKAKNHIFEKIFILFKKPYSYYLLHMSPLRDTATVSIWRRAKKEIKRRHTPPIELDQEFYLENDLLRKIDIATSYVSIEGRVPLLDVEVIENAKYFEEQNLKGGVLKAFLKKLLTAYLPEDMVYRNKSGFGLDMVKLFNESRFLKNDLTMAIGFLEDRGILKRGSIDIEGISKRYPHYGFLLISLWKSVSNNEKIA